VDGGSLPSVAIARGLPARSTVFRGTNATHPVHQRHGADSGTRRSCSMEPASTASSERHGGGLNRTDSGQKAGIAI